VLEEAEDSVMDASACRAQAPAGQLSALVSYNRVPPCSKNDVAGRAGGQAEDGEVLASNKVADVLGQALEAMEQLPAKEEEAFTGAMGRKAKPYKATPGGSKMMQHRGEPSEAGCAGDYPHERVPCKKRVSSHGRVGGTSPRSGVAMTLVPKEGDAAVVAKPTKARAAFAEGASAEASRHVVEQNQQNFRFAFTPARRSCSVPQQKGQGGAGLSSTSNARRLYRDREVSTPRRPPSSSRRGESGHVARALDREGGGREVKAERSHRMQSEQAFAEVCSFTKQSRQVMSKTSATIKSTLGNGQSSAMASLLVWG